MTRAAPRFETLSFRIRESSWSTIMWSQVQGDLQQILAAKIYPALIPDPVYRHYLVSAGLPPRDGAVPLELKKNFATAAKIRAHIIVAEVAQTKGLKESTCCAKLIEGPVILYRFWDSTVPENREGVWWFDRNVIDICKANTKRSAPERRDWLRKNLAVSMDWSRMDRIDLIELPLNSEVPAIQGVGQGMPVYSPSAIPKGKVENKEYWKDLGRYFPGGAKQTVLPFIPQAKGMDLNQFLSRS
jgi:hypothetical protein